MELNEGILAVDKREILNVMTDAIQDAMTLNNQLLTGITNENNQSLFPVINNAIQSDQILFPVVETTNDNQILTYDKDTSKRSKDIFKNDTSKSDINTNIDDCLSENLSSLQNVDSLHYYNQVIELNFNKDLTIENLDDSVGKVILDTSSDSEKDVDVTRESLIGKIDIIKPKKSFSCPHCNNLFSKWAELKKHSLTHTEVDIYTCMKCEYKGVSKRDLNKHLTSHSDKELSCNMCEYKCKERKSLRMHILTHTGEKPFACKECDYKCRQKGNLKVHILKHSGERPFECLECNNRFTQKIHLSRHMKYHHDKKVETNIIDKINSNLLSCSYCSFTCRSEIMLEKHLDDHRSNSPILCSKCGFSSNIIDASEMDIPSTHYKINPSEISDKKEVVKFSFIFCDFTTTERDALNQHLFINHIGSNELEYSGVNYKISIDPISKTKFHCPHCKYKSDKKRNLDLHLVTHSQIKIFECSFCKFKSKRNNDLKMHMMMHTGEKPHSCEQCLYKSSQKSNLLKHMKIHAT